MQYVLWIILSAAVFGKAIDSDRYGWMAFPAFTSMLCAAVCALCDLTGAVPM